MSSRKRRSQGEQSFDAFDIHSQGQEQEQETSHLDFETADARGYGTSGPLNIGTSIKGNPIPLTSIRPDPMQPRRPIPFKVHQTWDGDISTLFTTWQAVIQDENPQFDIATLLDMQPAAEGVATGETLLRSADPTSVEASLLKIIDLAASIQRDGLLNPITIVPQSTGQYYIETGERRWLAYHLLLQHTGDKEWKKIPAQTVHEFSVWRQASENNARDNLNAISQARQFALLLMDLLQQEGAQFKPFEAFESEQDFYAQVAESDAYRIPSGKSDLILSTMGVEHRNAIYRSRSLLKLPAEVWQLADDHNWTEYRLRDLVPPTSPKEAIALARQWAGLSPVGDNKMSKNKMSPAGDKSKKKLNRYERFSAKLIPRIVLEIRKMPDKERQQALDDLKHLIAELE